VMGNLMGWPARSCFFVGTMLWTFYRAHPDGGAGLANDAIFRYFIANEVPHGVVG